MALQTLTPSLTAASALPLAVAPTPDTVAAPHTGNSITSSAPDTSTLERTQGLYVTNGNINQRLIDYTENLDGQTKIVSFDDDHDGDMDVYYTI